MVASFTCGYHGYHRLVSGLSKDHRNDRDVGKDYTDARTKIYVYNFKTNKWNEVSHKHSQTFSC